MSLHPLVVAIDQLARMPGQTRRQRRVRRPQGTTSTRPVPGQRSR